MENKIIDIEKLNHDFDNNKDIIHELYDELFSSVAGFIDSMNLLLKNKNYDELIRISHTIKGGAYNLYADSLGDAAKEMEMLLRSGNTNGINESIDKLKINLKILEQNFKNNF